MSILKKLEEQTTFNFTGRINVLRRENGQHFGLIFLKDGLVVNAYFAETKGLKALMTLIFEDVHKNNDLKIIAEPEVIADSQLIFSLTIDEVKRQAAQYYNDYQNAKSLRPPDNVQLFTDPNFILNGSEIDPREFRMLYTLTKYNTVLDIYKNSEFTDHETTMLLVNLRKKKAIRVLKAS